MERGTFAKYEMIKEYKNIDWEKREEVKDFIWKNEKKVKIDMKNVKKY